MESIFGSWSFRNGERRTFIYFLRLEARHLAIGVGCPAFGVVARAIRLDGWGTTRYLIVVRLGQGVRMFSR